MKTRDVIELLLLAAIWGSSFLFMRVASPEFGPIPLVEIRVAIAAIFLVIVLAWRSGRGGLRGLLGKTVPMTFLGAVNSALPFSLFSYATLYVTAGFAAVVNASSPLFGALVAYLWFREGLSRPRILGLGIGFLGVVVLVWGNISFRGDGNGWAVVAALSASLAYGICANYTKRHLRGVDPIVTASGSQIAATVVLLPLAIRYWPATTPSFMSWVSAIALGIMCTGVAYIFYFRLLEHVGPTRALAVTYLIPLFGMIWGLVFLGEGITRNMIAGCAVILLGTALTTGTLTLLRRSLETR